MRGDLLFYAPRRSPRCLVGLFERLICRVTAGPFCHVAVDMGDGTKVEATLRGIVRTPTRGDEAARFPLAPHCGHDELEGALGWAARQVGEEYGLEDLLDAFLKYVCHTRWYVGAYGHYDCSDLAAHVCRLSDAVDLDHVESLHLITPNQLARLCGVIK